MNRHKPRTNHSQKNRFHLAQQWEQQQEEYLILLGFHP